MLSIDGMNRHGRQLARCRCLCGKEKVIDGGNIATGKSRSCGCRKGSKKPDGEAQLKSIFNRYLRQAAERHIDFGLSMEQFKSIVTRACHYCGAPPVFKQRREFSSGLEVTGVDRVDSFKGYCVDNCVPCCLTCNRAKSKMALDQFKSWISSVYHKTVAVQ